jgi:RNA polymerase sigma factor (sigma-70 family)
VNHERTEDFAEFYATACHGCFRAIHAAAGDPVQAEELNAEAFARAFAQWRKLQQHPAPQAWVVRVALNLHMSWWRKRRRAVRSRDDGLAFNLAETNEFAHGAPGRFRHGSTLSFDRPAFSALRDLPRRQREVVILLVFLDLDIYGTAEALGISPSTVAAHCSRAVATLRTALTPETDEERPIP